MRVLAVLLAVAMLSQAERRQERSSPQPPVFRAGVDVVQLDVSVLDRDRRPVRGLTAADFTVLEDGKPRRMVAFTAVDLPPRMRPRTAWLRDVAPDVTTNSVPDGRLVVIVFDRTIPFGWPASAARRFAVSAIDELGPGDLAAIVRTGVGRSQNFTADRARLLEAITSPGVGTPLKLEVASESGECFCHVCSLEAITRVAQSVRDVPERRKSLLYIGASVPSIPRIGDMCEAYLAGPREEMFRAAQAANLAVHAVDPRGLESFAIAADERPARLTGPALAARVVGAIRDNAERQNTLVELAHQTGGRAVLNTNAPEGRSAGMFDETTSYYLIAFERAETRTAGRFHPVEVKVKRRGVTVRTRRGYYEPRAERSAEPQPHSLPGAMASLLPKTELPLRVSVAPFALRGKSDAGLAIVLGVGRAPNSEQVTTLATFFDNEGQSVASLRGTVDVPRPTAAGDIHYEVVSRLDLKPGRYELRLVAEQNEPPQIGSVHAYVDVPDFGALPLSLSGVVLEATPALPVTIHTALSEVLPVTPTSARTFASTERVASFMRVYQGGNVPVGPVSVTSRLVDGSNRTVFNETTPLGSERFGADRAADYRVELPIGRLSAGPYLLTIEAVLDGTRRARREIRFAVASSRESTNDLPDRPLTVDALLRAAGTYLARYEHQISAVVAEENYIQTVSSRAAAMQRRLRSDLLVILDAVAGWVGFRDVYEVDGKPVRDRDDRIARLFLQPNPDPVRQARRIVAESARFNLNPPDVEISRSINMPVMALKFLQEQNQRRSRFTSEGTATIGGRHVAILRFAEQAKPRLIASPDNAAARGAFWIELDSGRVARSELSIQTGSTTATIRVAFAEEPRLKLWLPVSMDERYVISRGGTAIEGRATYSNFRQFIVATDTAIKEPTTPNVQRPTPLER
jgi:VWFA-related protein